MGELSKMMENKANYYALLIAICCGETADEALADMGLFAREEK